MATLGDLVLRVSASSVEFDRGLDKAAQSAKKFSRDAGGLLSNPYLATAAAAIGGVASIGAFAASLRETASEMVRLTRESQKLGVTTEELSGLQHAAEISGVEFGTLTSALEKLQHRLAGTGDSGNEAQAAIAALGLNFADLKSQNPAAQLEGIADAIAQLPTANDQISATFAIFGREGGGLVSLLQKGKAGIEDLKNEAKNLGLTFDGIDAGRVERANAAVMRLGSVWDGIKRSLVIEGAPVVEGIATAFTDAVKEAGGFRNVFKSLVDVVVSGLIAVSGTLDEIITTVDKFTKSHHDGGTFDSFTQDAGDVLTGLGILDKPTAVLASKGGGPGLHNPALQKMVDFLTHFREVADKAANAANGVGDSISDMQAKLKLTNGINTLTEKLREQIETFGLSGAQLDIYKLKQKGATDAELAQAEALAKGLDRLQDVTKLVEQARTPLETFADTYAKINDLLADGEIDADTAGSALSKAFDQLDTAKGATEFHSPQALTEGSREAVSAVLRAQHGNEAESVQERIERVLKAQKDAQDRQTNLQQQMLAALQNPKIAQLSL